eukprot:3565018-Prymnesium_polylepis.1
MANNQMKVGVVDALSRLQAYRMLRWLSAPTAASTCSPSMATKWSVDEDTSSVAAGGPSGEGRW